MMKKKIWVVLLAAMLLAAVCISAASAASCSHRWITVTGGDMLSQKCTKCGATRKIINPNTAASTLDLYEESASIKLSWSSGNFDATGYRIYRDGKLVKTVGINTRTWTDTSVATNGTYEYGVVPYYKDSDGTITYGKKIFTKYFHVSNTMNWHVNATIARWMTATITWDPANDAIGARVRLICVDANKTVETKTVVGNEAVFDYLINGATYKTGIRSYQNSGAGKVFSKEWIPKAFTFGTKSTTTPTIAAVKSAALTNPAGGVMITWTNAGSGALCHRIYRNGKLLGTISGPSVYYKDTTATDGKQSRYSVVTYFEDWKAGKVVSKSATPKNAQGRSDHYYIAPVGKISRTGRTFTWTAVTRASGYLCECYDAETGKRMDGSGFNTKPSCTISGMVSGKAYTFKVTTIRNVGKDFEARTFYADPVSITVTYR